MSRSLTAVVAALSLGVVSCVSVSTRETTTTTAMSESTTTVPPATTTAPTTATTSPQTSNPTTTTTTVAAYLPPAELGVEAFPVVEGSRPHDVAPAADGGVWYTAQPLGELGYLDPGTGETVHIPLGDGARPHGVITDDEGTAWVTDGGLNAVVSVDPATHEVTAYPMPEDRPDVGVHTATFDDEGVLWFTGQAGGVVGSLDPDNAEMHVYDAAGGPGPYGITATPDGSVFYANLGASYVGEVANDGSVNVLEPPTPDQGARRVWSDSEGSIWVSEWNTGNLSRYAPETGEWTTWPLPGDDPAAYGVYVDEADTVWLSDFGANAMVRFDPASEQFDSYPLPHNPGEVRQILGRPGEVWGAESAADQLIVIRTR